MNITKDLRVEVRPPQDTSLETMKRQASEYVRRQMRDGGLTQRELAERSRCEISYIMEISEGRIARVNLDILNRVLRVFSAKIEVEYRFLHPR